MFFCWFNGPGCDRPSPRYNYFLRHFQWPIYNPNWWVDRLPFKNALKNYEKQSLTRISIDRKPVVFLWWLMDQDVTDLPPVMFSSLFIAVVTTLLMVWQFLAPFENDEKCTISWIFIDMNQNRVPPLIYGPECNRPSPSYVHTTSHSTAPVRSTLRSVALGFLELVTETWTLEGLLFLTEILVKYLFSGLNQTNFWGWWCFGWLNVKGV